MSKVFPVSFISDGRYWQSGEEIPDEFIRPFMLKHWKKAPPGMKVNNLRRQYNKAYPVSVEEHEMSMPAKRQAAQMQIAAEQEELDETEANTLDETTVSALAELQDKFAGDVERQKLNAQIEAERHDELDNALLEEQEEKAQAGEFDEMDSDPRPKPKVGPARVIGQKLFVKRNGKFVQAHNIEVIQGETLYRYRPRSMGQTAMFIKHATVK